MAITHYADSVFQYIKEQKIVILDTANKLGVSPGAIAGLMAEEYNSILLDRSRQEWADAYANFVLLNHSVIESYYALSILGDTRDSKPSDIDKFFNPTLIDVGNANIKLGTAIFQLHRYNDRFPTTDPLDLKQYNDDYRLLLTHLLDPLQPTTARFAGLVGLDAKEFFASRADASYMNMLSDAAKDGLYVTYGNFGPVLMQTKYSEGSQGETVPYEPKLGEGTAGGWDHVFNATKLGDAIDIQGYGSIAQVVAGSTPIPGSRPPSILFLDYQGTNSVILKKGGTLSDVIAVEKSKGNLISKDELVLVNPDLGRIPENRIPEGTKLIVPVKVNERLVVSTADATISFNPTTGEYDTLVNSPVEDVTVLFKRQLGADGHYTDVYVKTDKSTGLEIQRIETPVSSEYESRFNNGVAPENALFAITPLVRRLQTQVRDPLWHSPPLSSPDPAADEHCAARTGRKFLSLCGTRRSSAARIRPQTLKLCGADGKEIPIPREPGPRGPNRARRRAPTSVDFRDGQ